MSIRTFTAMMAFLAILPSAGKSASEDFGDWVIYQAPDISFRVDFPVTPVVSVCSGTVSGRKAYVTRIRVPDASFAVYVTDLADGTARSTFDSWVRSREGVVPEYSRYFFKSTDEGREALSFQRGVWVRERMYVKVNRIYR